jgi:AcrR family transcriptional regulator
MPDMQERRPGRPRDASADDAILAAAREIITRDGYGRLSMEKVAAAAGVGKPTLYRRWPSKSALVGDAVLGSFLAAVPATPTLEGSAAVPVAERLSAWCRAFATAAADPDHAALVLALTAAAAESPLAAESLYRHHSGPHHEALVTCLRLGVERGEFHADADLEAVADAVTGSVLYQLLTRTQDASPASTEHLLDLLLAGLRR